jgi:hypothetical protein
MKTKKKKSTKPKLIDPYKAVTRRFMDSMCKFGADMATIGYTKGLLECQQARQELEGTIGTLKKINDDMTLRATTAEEQNTKRWKLRRDIAYELGVESEYSDESFELALDAIKAIKADRDELVSLVKGVNFALYNLHKNNVPVIERFGGLH